MSRSETPELTALAATYEGALLIYKGDVAKDEDNKQAVEVTMQAFGRLDALIRESLVLLRPRKDSDGFFNVTVDSLLHSADPLLAL